VQYNTRIDIDNEILAYIINVGKDDGVGCSQNLRSKNVRWKLYVSHNKLIILQFFESTYTLYVGNIVF